VSPSPGAPIPTSDLRDQLQATLSGSYIIERELGSGGMARVSVAEETALRRTVVIKVLPPETAAQVSHARPA
jgi:serine/threonine-protein kinase